MLGHLEARPGDHKGRGGGDVEGPGPLAPGAAGIGDGLPVQVYLVPVQGHLESVQGDGLAPAPEGQGRPADLIHGLAFHFQGRQKRSGLGRGGPAVYYPGHGPVGFVFRQVLPPGRFGDCFLDHDLSFPSAESLQPVFRLYSDKQKSPPSEDGGLPGWYLVGPSGHTTATPVFTVHHHQRLAKGEPDDPTRTDGAGNDKREEAVPKGAFGMWFAEQTIFVFLKNIRPSVKQNRDLF